MIKNGIELCLLIFVGISVIEEGIFLFIKFREGILSFYPICINSNSNILCGFIISVFYTLYTTYFNLFCNSFTISISMNIRSNLSVLLEMKRFFILSY